ncbi:hypothetical protein V1509DRAFT_615690 [Lipomyces kononenkoae]
MPITRQNWAELKFASRISLSLLLASGERNRKEELADYMALPDYFKLALAIAIIRAKPVDVNITDYRLQVLQRIDPTEFWKTKYNDTIREVHDLRAQIDLLKIAIGNKRKRDDDDEQDKSGRDKTKQQEIVVREDPKELRTVSSSGSVPPISSTNIHVKPFGQSSDPHPANVNSDLSVAPYMTVFMSDVLRESTRILLTNEYYKSAVHIREHVHVSEQYIAPTNDDEIVVSPEYVVKTLGLIIFRLECASFQKAYGIDCRECEGTNNAGGGDKVLFQDCLTSLLRGLLRGIGLLTRRMVCSRDERCENGASGDDSLDVLLAAYGAVILATAARSHGLRKGIIILLFEHLRNILTDPHSFLFGASKPRHAISKLMLQIAASHTAKRYLLLLEHMTPRELESEYSTVRYEIESLLFGEDGVGQSSLGPVAMRQVIRTYCLLPWKDE